MADLLPSAEGMAGPDDARGKPFRGGQEVGPSAEGQNPRSLVGCTRIGSEYLSEKLVSMCMIGANGRPALAKPGLELSGEDDGVLEEIVCFGLLGADSHP